MVEGRRGKDEKEMIFFGHYTSTHLGILCQVEYRIKGHVFCDPCAEMPLRGF
jgi:hypothetical protein